MVLAARVLPLLNGPTSDRDYDNWLENIWQHSGRHNASRAMVRAGVVSFIRDVSHAALFEWPDVPFLRTLGMVVLGLLASRVRGVTFKLIFGIWSLASSVVKLCMLEALRETEGQWHALIDCILVWQYGQHRRPAACSK